MGMKYHVEFVHYEDARNDVYDSNRFKASSLEECWEIVKNFYSKKPKDENDDDPDSFDVFIWKEHK